MPDTGASGPVATHDNACDVEPASGQVPRRSDDARQRAGRRRAPRRRACRGHGAGAVPRRARRPGALAARPQGDDAAFARDRVGRLRAASGEPRARRRQRVDPRVAAGRRGARQPAGRPARRRHRLAGVAADPRPAARPRRPGPAPRARRARRAVRHGRAARGAQATDRADRPARRRQVDARPAPRRGTRGAVRRAESRDRARGRATGSRRSTTCSARRRTAATSAVRSTRRWSTSPTR